MRASSSISAVSLALLALSACADERGVGGELGEWSEPLTAACPPTPDPFAGPVQGIDISQYQTVSSWAKVAASEQFVIIKATEATYTDPKFSSHRAGAKGTNLTVGYYHYLRFSMSGVTQANAFIKAVGALEPDDLPPMLDVEDSPGADANSPAENAKIVQEWLDTVEAALGKRPFIYSGGGFWGRPSFGNPAQFANYYFCWSKYSASNSCPQVPDNLVSRIKMWQYRADAFPQYNIPAGQTDGINGAVDQDVFYGDLAAFKGFVGAAAPEYAAKYSKQSYPLASVGAVEVKVGESVNGYIEMTNTGTATWSPGKVFLAPIPRDAASPYHAPSWKSPTRVSTVDKDVAPGQVGHFALDIGGSAPGDGSLKLGWVAEGVTWFADAPKGGGPKDGVAEVKVHVIPGTGGAGAGGAAGASAGGKAGATAGGKGGASAAGKGGASGWTGPGGAAGAGIAGAAGAVSIAGASSVAGASGAPAMSRVLPASDEGDGGCGCRAAPRRGGAPWLVAGLLGVFSLRRRRARA